MAYPRVVTGQIIKPVTNILIARKNEENQFLADKILPVVPNIKDEVGEIFAMGNDHLRSYNSERGVWDETQHRIEFNYTRDVFYRLKYFDLEMYLPDRFMDQFSDPLDPERDASVTLMQTLLLQKELALASLMTSTTILTNNTTLTGSDQWNETATSTPLQDMQTAKSSARISAGYSMNSVLIPRAVLDVLKFHPDFTDQVSGITYVDDEIIVSLIKKNLGVKNVLIGETTYITSNEGQTEAFGDVWGKDVIFFYKPDNVSLMQKSFGYTFELASDQLRVTRYRAPNDTGNNVRVAMNFDQKILDTNLAYLIKNAIA